MKKSVFLIMVLIGIVLVNNAAASIVTGTVYAPAIGEGNELGDADVYVECNSYTRETASGNTSQNLGDYAVEFSDNECPAGSTVTVTSTKDDMSGTQEGVMTSYGLSILLAVINIGIPEFTAITASLALAGAAAGYLGIRKNKRRQ